jgi:hypothetical protein
VVVLDMGTLVTYVVVYVLIRDVGLLVRCEAAALVDVHVVIVAALVSNAVVVERDTLVEPPTVALVMKLDAVLKLDVHDVVVAADVTT